MSKHKNIELENTGFEEISEQFVRERVILAQTRLKEAEEEIMAGLDTVKSEELTLEISTEKPEYNKDEDIKIKLLFKNTGTLPVKGINDPAGTYGFDVLVVKDGVLVKRLKKELGVIRVNEELPVDIFTIEPGTALSSEIPAFSASEEKTQEEVEIIISYVGGPEVAGAEKGWIKHPVVSNELKIKIRK